MSVTRGLIISLGIAILSAGCGKVTQPSTKPTEAALFSWESDVRVTTANRGGLTLSDAEVYTQVSRLYGQNKQREEGWGKGVIRSEKHVGKTQKEAAITVYVSTAYQKEGLVIKKADHQWVKMALDTTKRPRWTIKADKLKKVEHSFYVMAIFTPDKTRYAMKVLPYKAVSNNASVQTGLIRDYDTFLATMLISDSQDEAVILSLPEHWEYLTQLFAETTWSALHWQQPRNAVKAFHPKKPRFLFSSPQLDALRGIFYACLSPTVSQDDLDDMINAYPAAIIPLPYKAYLRQATRRQRAG